MKFRRTSRFYLLTGLISLFAFAGDIVIDAVADACGDHCVSESPRSDSHNDKTPCSHCSCAVHNGSVVVLSSSVNLTGPLAFSFLMEIADQSALPGLPVAIDHPPQLA